MALSNWLIAVLLFLTIFFLAFGIGWWLRIHYNPTPPPPNKYTAPDVWSLPVAGPTPSKNICQLYEFPTGSVIIDGSNVAVPGTPTFDPMILDALTGNTGIPLCVDTDQIVARQVQHTCSAPFGVVDGAINLCYLITGGQTGLGGKETFYTNAGCNAAGACAGQLSLVSLNYNPPAPIDCAVDNGPNNVTMKPCDPTMPDQLFRVTRINPGQNPNNLVPGAGQNGLFAQILDRNTGQCLVLGTGITGGVDYTGVPVVFGTCTGGSYPGYIWLMLPSGAYCANPNGCAGCTGCASCVRMPRTNLCGGCGGCTGYDYMITCPMIIYAGNLNISQIPSGNTGYAGLTGFSATFQWLLDNKAQALYYSSYSGSQLITTDITKASDCLEQRNENDFGFIAQYINLTLYNTISQEAVCFANDFTTPNCVNL